MTAVAQNLVTIEKIVTALQIGSNYNFSAAIVAFKGEDPDVKIESAYMAVEDVVQILGLFIPEAAMAAEYMQIGQALLPIVLPYLLEVLNIQPAKPGLGQIDILGHVFDIPNYF